MGRSPMCKTCVSYLPNPDGTVVCEYSGRIIDAKSKPPSLDTTCYERRQKKKLSPTELVLARSIAGRKGGKKAGYGKGRAPTKTMTIRLLDYHVIVAYARELNVFIAEAIHRIAKAIVKNHPNTKPTGWIEDEQKSNV